MYRMFVFFPSDISVSLSLSLFLFSPTEAGPSSPLRRSLWSRCSLWLRRVEDYACWAEGAHPVLRHLREIRLLSVKSITNITPFVRLRPGRGRPVVGRPVVGGVPLRARARVRGRARGAEEVGRARALGQEGATRGGQVEGCFGGTEGGFQRSVSDGWRVCFASWEDLFAATFKKPSQGCILIRGGPIEHRLFSTVCHLTPAPNSSPCHALPKFHPFTRFQRSSVQLREQAGDVSLVGGN